MSLLKTPTINALYRHFVVATSKSRAAIYEQELNVEPQPTFSDIQQKVFEKAVQDKEEPNPLFTQYCTETD